MRGHTGGYRQNTHGTPVPIQMQRSGVSQLRAQQEYTVMHITTWWRTLLVQSHGNSTNTATGDAIINVRRATTQRTDHERPTLLARLTAKQCARCWSEPNPHAGWCVRDRIARIAGIAGSVGKRECQQANDSSGSRKAGYWKARQLECGKGENIFVISNFYCKLQVIHIILHSGSFWELVPASLFENDHKWHGAQTLTK